jgi:hypothetical protein
MTGGESEKCGAPDSATLTRGTAAASSATQCRNGQPIGDFSPLTDLSFSQLSLSVCLSLSLSIDRSRAVLDTGGCYPTAPPASVTSPPSHSSHRNHSRRRALATAAPAGRHGSPSVVKPAVGSWMDSGNHIGRAAGGRCQEGLLNCGGQGRTANSFVLLISTVPHFQSLPLHIISLSLSLYWP